MYWTSREFRQPNKCDDVAADVATDDDVAADVAADVLAVELGSDAFRNLGTVLEVILRRCLLEMPCLRLINGSPGKLNASFSLVVVLFLGSSSHSTPAPELESQVGS